MVPIILMFLAGMGLSIQVAMNARLRLGLHSPVAGALVSFLVGSLFLLILLLFQILGRTRWEGATGVPWWGWLGGFMGAAYVVYVIVAVKAVGAGPAVAASLIGQLVMAVVLDTTGWMGISQKPLTVQKLMGMVLLIAGIVVMQWKR